MFSQNIFQDSQFFLSLLNIVLVFAFIFVWISSPYTYSMLAGGLTLMADERWKGGRKSRLWWDEYEDDGMVL